MIEYFESHKFIVIYALSITIGVVLLRAANNKMYRWITNKLGTNREFIQSGNFILAKKIINALILAIGIIALAFIFIGEERYGEVKEKHYLVLYLDVVAVCTLITESLVQAWFKSSIQERIKANEDPTNFKFLRYIAIFAVYLMGGLLALYAFPFLRGTAKAILSGAGILAVIAGVASQEALANIVGGIFIISFKPFKIGDIVRVNDFMEGTVYDITLRHTVIKNYENKMIVIPNSVISKEKLINYDLGGSECCQWINIDISYDSDIDLAKQIMRAECEAHPYLIEYRSELQKYNKEQKVNVRVINLGESSVTIRAWAWAANYSNAFIMKCDLYESIKKRFDKEGISIPYPHRTLVMEKKQFSKITKEDNQSK